MIPKSYIENYIQTGKQFPPETEAVRLAENRKYQAVFDGKFLDLFPHLRDKLFMDLVNKDGEIERFIETTIPRFPSLIEKKFCNLAFGKTRLFPTKQMASLTRRFPTLWKERISGLPLRERLWIVVSLVTALSIPTTLFLILLLTTNISMNGFKNKK